MTIEENEKIVGTGSWNVTQSYGDYRDRMSFEEYRTYLYQKCKERVESYDLQEGDSVTVTSIGGYKPRRYKGIVHMINSGDIILKQVKRTIRLDCTLIDDIEVVQRKKVVSMFKARRFR